MRAFAREYARADANLRAAGREPFSIPEAGVPFAVISR